MRPTSKKKSRGIQAVTASAGAIAAVVGSAAGAVEGKPRAVLAAVASILTLVAAFSHPPAPASTAEQD